MQPWEKYLRLTKLRWEQLLRMSDKQLAAYDIAEVNLACAVDLPGSWQIDLDFCRKKLDHYTFCVREYTAKQMKQFYRKPSDFRNSESYFRILAMITVLQRDLGVRYNKAKIPVNVPLDTADSFVHGILQGDGGTCASLPVLYVSVGRRLGYPLKLVAAVGKRYGHLFARWDDPNGERFNIEATNKGFSRFTDDYYRKGIYKDTAKFEEPCYLLKSLKPREELAHFICQRGHQWRQKGEYRNAVDAFSWAYGLMPYNKAFADTFFLAMNLWKEDQDKKKPLGYPEVVFFWSPFRRLPASVPLQWEKNKLYLDVHEDILMLPDLERDCWGPRRRGETPRRWPYRVDVYFPDNRIELRVKCVVDRDPLRITVLKPDDSALNGGEENGLIRLTDKAIP